MWPFGNDKVKELFAFNLLPPKSKEEVKEEIKRKKTFAYSLTAPVLCIAISLILVLLNAIAAEPTRASWDDAVQKVRKEMADPNNGLGLLKIINGELKLKTDFIAEPVQKNVNFDEIFKITETIFQNTSSQSIPTSYGREDDGRFIVNAVSKSEGGPAEILKKFQSDPKIRDPRLSLVSKLDDTSDYGFTISFEINSLNLES